MKTVMVPSQARHISIYVGVCTLALFAAAPSLAEDTASSTSGAAQTISGQMTHVQTRPASKSPKKDVQLAQGSTQIGAAAAATRPTPDGTSESSSRGSIEAVVVSASRVSREGFIAPTPTTVLNERDLNVGGPTNVSAALENLPSFAPTNVQSFSRANNNAGQNLANLRDLGIQRTLVLMDGARLPPTSISTMAFDLAAIPSQLIQRVEVVTGGASAQWGSDAVAGVINIVMDNEFVGLKANVQDGRDTQGYGSNEFKADLAYGTTFDGGRGHFMVGGGFDAIKSVVPARRNPIGTYGLIANPSFTATCGCAQSLFVNNLLQSNANIGGLITAGPLKGTDFGPGGTVGTFQYGQLANASTMVGGDPSARLYFTGPTFATGVMNSPLMRANIYTQASYDITDHTKLTFDLFANLTQQNPTPYTDFFSLGNITIQNTNAYLPAQIVTAMAANKITSFSLGRDNADFGIVSDSTLSATEQMKIGAKGDFGDSWTWDGRYGYGQTQRTQRIANQPIAANFANSVNAIVSPTTGQPVCAIALTNPATNCVPVNLLGAGSPSAAALGYFEGASISHHLFYQHELAANLRGEPFSLWAGPVSIAAGAEYRIEGVSAYADPITVAKGFAFTQAIYLASNSYSVGEGYFETVVPLLRDLPMLQKVDFNGAVRVSDYSTSGVIPSWKLGLTDNVTDELLLRGTISRDIRAPNLAELYTLPSSVVNTVTANGTQYTIASKLGGNPTLGAELSDTWTVGATYQPGWASGVNLALDYYSTRVNNAIATLTAQAVVNQCYQGNVAAACASITTSSTGAITAVQATFLNLAVYNSAGVDLEADYTSDLEALGLPGQINFRWLATYISELKQVTGLVSVPIAGDIGALAPRVRSTWTLNYDIDAVEMTARARFISAGAYTLTQVVDTRVPAQTYFDLGFQWNLPTDVHMTLYGNVNNLFNTVNPAAVLASSALTDPFGRTYNVGLRLALQ